MNSENDVTSFPVPSSGWQQDSIFCFSQNEIPWKF